MNEKRPTAAFILLVFLQVADGLFSFHGIQKVGLRNYEVNPLIIYLSEYLGFFHVLLTVKAVAIVLVYFLYRIGAVSALWFLAGIYSLNLFHQIMFFLQFNGWI